MKVFVAASYSDQVNYDTGEVFPEYKAWLEDILQTIQNQGHTVFCALRADNYKINNDDPAAAFNLDFPHITESDVLLALLTDTISAGVQTEIGVALAQNKIVVLAHLPEQELAYFNMAIVRSGHARELALPLDHKQLIEVLLP